MAPAIVNVLTFCAAFLAVFAGNAVLVDISNRRRKHAREQLEEQLRARQRLRVRKETNTKEFSKIAAEARAENLRKDHSWIQSLKYMLQQAGMDLSPITLLALCSSLGILFKLAVVLLGGNFVLVAIVFVVGFAIPLLYVRIRRDNRLELIRQQLPDAFDLMSRVLRSGQTISQAMQSVAEEFEKPISLEFLYCYEQMNLGLPAESALRDLARRTGLLEVKIFVMAVVVHRQTGGNLAELLDKLALVVRERFRIRGMINSLTAQGRFQALILLSLPPFMFVLLLYLNTEYEMMLVHNPVLLFSAIGMMALGAIWVRSIVNFDF